MGAEVILMETDVTMGTRAGNDLRLPTRRARAAAL